MINYRSSMVPLKPFFLAGVMSAAINLIVLMLSVSAGDNNFSDWGHSPISELTMLYLFTWVFTQLGLALLMLTQFFLRWIGRVTFRKVIFVFSGGLLGLILFSWTTSALLGVVFGAVTAGLYTILAPDWFVDAVDQLNSDH